MSIKTEIKEVFYERLTDDIFERYGIDNPDIEKGKEEARELIKKDIEEFATIMRTLGVIIPKDKWLKDALHYINQ